MGPRIKGSTWIVETGGRGRRFNSLHPHSSFSYLSSGSMISLNPPLPRPPPPFSTCDWLPFVIFRQASLVFALFLFNIRSIESFILLRCFFSSNFFPPRTYLLTYLLTYNLASLSGPNSTRARAQLTLTNVNAESPESALSDPSNF
jgi:hypothetical protein